MPPRKKQHRSSALPPPGLPRDFPIARSPTAEALIPTNPSTFRVVFYSSQVSPEAWRSARATHRALVGTTNRFEHAYAARF